MLRGGKYRHLDDWYKKNNLLANIVYIHKV